MVIAFVTIEFVEKNKATTGLPNYLYRVSKALKALGHEPIVITAGSRNEKAYYDGIQVIRRNVGNVSITKSNELNYVYNAISMSIVLNMELKKLCRNRKIDIVQFCSLYGLGMFYFGKVPAIMRLSSYAKEYFKYSDSFSESQKRIMSFIERVSAIPMNGVIAPSNVMGTAFARDIHHKVHIIETPFVNDCDIENEKIYKQYFKEKNYILFFGTLYEEKGIYVISKMIHKILEANPDYYFAFIGKVQKNVNKDPLKILRKEAGEYANRIIYLPPLKHEFLYPVIRHADIVTLPSLMDNFPNTCIEAMYLRKVVVGTDGTSFEQLIKDGVNGYLAKPNDSNSLYEKIQSAIHLSEKEKTKMENQARKRINSLSPEVVVEELVKYYEKVICNTKKRQER